MNQIIKATITDTQGRATFKSIPLRLILPRVDIGRDVTKTEIKFGVVPEDEADVVGRDADTGHIFSEQGSE